MEEYSFLLCGDICQDGENWSIFHRTSQVSASSTGLCRAEDGVHADRLGKHLEISDRILDFFLDIN